MTEIVVAQRMWQRRDSTANWNTKNPIMAKGEIGFEYSTADPTTLVGMKVGNGVTAWVSLPYGTPADSQYVLSSEKGAALGVATLTSDSKLDPGQLPALAITETFVVNSEASMLALTAQQGDVAVRIDLHESLILTASPASTLSNWQPLLTPTGGVTSFNTRTGPVVPATGDYTPAQVGAEPAIATGTAAQYRRGDKTWQDLAAAVRSVALAGLSTAVVAAISAADSVLVAFGKLQAQISANTSKLDLVTSGTYTPLLTPVANVASASVSGVYYQRIGNVVAVSGIIAVTSSVSSATTQFRMSLPIESAMASNDDASGVCNVGPGSAGFIRGDSATDTAMVQFIAPGVGAVGVRFSFMYVVTP